MGNFKRAVGERAKKFIENQGDGRKCHPTNGIIELIETGGETDEVAVEDCERV